MRGKSTITDVTPIWGKNQMGVSAEEASVLAQPAELLSLGASRDLSGGLLAFLQFKGGFDDVSRGLG
jgi:hypothetical protein